MHPADHVQDQQTGYQQHRALEPFATAAGQPVAGAQHAPAQRDGQAEPGGDAGPEHAQGVAGTRLLTQPRMQDADDQQGLDAFAPDDEHGLAHGCAP